MHHVYRTLNVPLEAVQVVTQDGLLNPFKIYLSLKFTTGDGQIRLSDIDLQAIAETAGFKDARTAQTHIDTCLELNWLGTDGEWLFIRSFERIRSFLEAESRSAVEVRPIDVPKLLELILGAKIEHSGRAKRHARKKGGAKPQSAEPFTDLGDQKGEPYGAYRISCSLIGEWFGFSPSSASRLKQRARRAGYLDYRHRYKNTGAHKQNFAALAEWIDRERIAITRSGHLVIRLTDQFITNRNGNHVFKFKSRAVI